MNILITHFDGEEYELALTFPTEGAADEYLQELLVRGYDAHLTN